MRKIALLLVTILATLFNLSNLAWAEENSLDVNLAPNAKSAILIDMDTGEIMFAKNEHERLPPASITKIMTMLLIMEALDRGDITIDQKVKTSEYAESMGGSQIFLKAGEEMSVHDLLKAIAVASANDASVAMAEFLAGSEALFVQKMNERAKELGMENTNFVNASGLPALNHYTSAYDIGLMSRALLSYEEITEYTKIYQDYLRKDTDNPFWLVNTNRLVRFYPDADGLKTGYTSEALFCLSATAKRDSFRVIAIVMGEPNIKVRNQEVTEMFNFAFSNYTNHVLYEKGAEVATAKVDKGTITPIKIVTPHQFGILSRKGTLIDDFTQEIMIDNNLKAPLNKGEVVGKLLVKKDEKVISEINLITAEASERVNLWQMMKRTFKNVLN